MSLAERIISASQVPGIAYRMIRAPHIDRSRIVEFQNRKLRQIVSFAYERVAYYREIFDRAGLTPRDIRGREDLRHIPITTRKDLQGQPVERIVARGIPHSKLIVRTTTGSTGEPLTIRRLPVEELLTGVLRWRAMAYYGLKRRDTFVRIGTRTRADMAALWRFGQLFGQFRQFPLSLLDPPQIIVKKLLEIEPDVISGNAGVLARVSAEFLDAGEIPSRLKFVVTGAEVLTPMMKSAIGRAFRCPVYDTYASEELDLIAWECRETGLYHVCDDHLLLEIERNGRTASAGEPGDVIATSLHLTAQPFLRYRLGDEARIGEPVCGCGLPFSTIQSIEGRKTDYLILPGGREVFASSIAYLLHEDAPWIRQYELVQEREDRIILRFVAGHRPDRDGTERLRRRVLDRLGPGVEVRFEHVRELVPAAGGKYRVLRSHVRSSYESKGTAAP